MVASGLVVAGLCALAVGQAATLGRYPYLQNAGSDRVTVLWTTAEQPASAVVQYSTDRSYLLAAEAATVRFGTTQTGLSAAYFQHQAELRGLRPNTEYFYRVVVDGQALTSGDAFRTAGSNPFTFLAFGDSGQDNLNQRELARLMLRENPALVLHTGDIAYESGTFEQFQRTYFGYYQDLMKRAPFFPVPGNHEYYTQNAAPYLALHSFPADGVPSVDRGRYYSFDWANVHFVALDTNMPLENAVTGRGQMLQWLDSDLGGTRAYWRIVYFHHPAFPTERHEQGPISSVVRDRLVPILERHRVPIVISGHEHSYQRSFPMRARERVEAGQGTVHIITGGGGAALYSVVPRPWLAEGQSAHHFMRVTADGFSLRVQAVRIDGQVIDNFELKPPPILAAGATVDAASFGRAIAPGGLISIFGLQFAPRDAAATTVPLPAELGSVSVTLNNRSLPLLYVSGTQINAQLPFDVSGPVTLRVTTPNAASAEVQATVAEVAPAIFNGAILRRDFTVVNFNAPADPGEFISVYLTGLGRVNGSIVAGQAAPTTQLLTVRVPVEVRIGDLTVTAAFAGLAPGFVGLYQVNAQVPEGIEGGSHPLRIVAGGVLSNTITLPVRGQPRPPPEPEP